MVNVSKKKSNSKKAEIATKKYYSDFYNNTFEKMKFQLTRISKEHGEEEIDELTVEDYLNVATIEDIEKLCPVDDKFLMGIFLRLFHSRNVLSGKNIVQFGGKDKEYSKLIREVASRAKDNVDKNFNIESSYVMHVQMTASAIFTSCTTALIVLNLFPRELSPQKFGIVESLT